MGARVGEDAGAGGMAAALTLTISDKQNPAGGGDAVANFNLLITFKY